jgi:hypothetical protein
VDLIDFSTGHTTAIAQFNGGRRSFSTVGVTDDQLILVGGYDESIRLTRSYGSVPVGEL